MGYLWEINSPGVPLAIEVWKDGDNVVIRQEVDEQVDILTLNPGQTYDLLKALARSLEVP